MKENEYWKQVVMNMSYDQLAELEFQIEETRRKKQNTLRSPSGAPYDPLIEQKINELLAKFKAAIVLVGGAEIPNHQLAKWSVDHLLDIAVRNNISIHVWPEKCTNCKKLS